MATNKVTPLLRPHLAYVNEDPAQTIQNCRDVLAFCQMADDKLAELGHEPAMGSSHVLSMVEKALEHAQREIEAARQSAKVPA